MATFVDDFKSKAQLDAWLAHAATTATVVDVATTKRWGVLLGFLGDTKTYTVTYDASARITLPKQVDDGTNHLLKLLVFWGFVIGAALVALFTLVKPAP